MTTTHLTISLLGAFEVAVDGETVTQFGADTARALLAYLAMDPGTAHRRDALAGLFWPDHPNAAALRNLRMTLSRLRDAIGDREVDPPFLDASRRTLALSRDARLSVDVWSLREALAAVEGHDHPAPDKCDICAERLQAVADLYVGEFLAGFAIDSAPFEEWMTLERESLHWKVLEALATLTSYHESLGDYDAAIAYARRQVELEPWREVAHRQWMRALALSGRRNAALAQFEACREILSDELGVEPEAQTRTLYEQIRAGELTSKEAETPGTPPQQAPTPPAPAAFRPSTMTRQTAATPPERAPTPPVEPRPAEPERRTVTVVCAKVTGAEDMLAEIGVEGWATTLSRLLHAAGTEVQRFGGEVVRRDDNRLLATFGAGSTHEDDPERATLAALGMQQAFESELRQLAVAAVEWRDGLVDLDLRLAVHTGRAIVSRAADLTGTGPHPAADNPVDLTVMGDAVTSAKELLRHVPPGEIRVGEATYRLVAPLFEWGDGEAGSAEEAGYTPLAHAGLKGKGRGIPGMRSPLVGRDRELGALLEAVERVKSGIGAIATLVGDAGIGKSRLVAEVRASQARHARPGDGPSVRWVEGRCLSYSGTTAYTLWVSVLRALIDVTDSAGASAVGRALRRQMEPLAPEDAEAFYPYLARLLGAPLDAEAESAITQMDAARRQEATFHAVATIIEATAARQPLVIVCEDLHWADPTSLRLLEDLLAIADRVPVLFLCVLRPRREHGCWRIREMAVRTYPHRHVDLQLQPLSAADGEMMVRKLLLSAPGPEGRQTVEGLPASLKRRILERSEGIPFYVEEILRDLIRQGVIACDEASCRWEAEDAAEVGIPDTLYGVLRARIDRLPAGARNVLRLASVIGRIFSLRLLADIAEGGALDHHLVTLQREQLIRQHARSTTRAGSESGETVDLGPDSHALPVARRSSSVGHRLSSGSQTTKVQRPDHHPPSAGLSDTEYIFQHQLTLEAAYAGLLQRARRTLHRRVAEAMERLYPERVGEHLGLLAHHWEQAGETGRAVDYLRRASERAAAQYANDEALAHLARALALTPESDRQTQYALLMHRVTIYDRIGARDAQAADLRRLQEIADALDDGTPAGKRRLAQVALRETELYEYTSSVEDLAAAAQRAIRLAQSTGDAALEAKGRHAWGVALTHTEDPDGARRQWQLALDLARESGDRQAEARVLRRLGISGATSWEQAKTYLEENLRIQQELGNRAEEGAAWNALAGAENQAHDPVGALAYLSEGIRLCRTTGLRREEAWGHFTMGMSYCSLGRFAAADDRAQQAGALFREVGDPGGESAATVLLALIAQLSGDDAMSQKHAQRAIKLADGADARAPALAGRFVMANALASMGRWAEAEEAYRQVLERAEHMGAAYLAMGHAGLARAALARDDPSGAATHIEPVVRTLQDDPLLYQSPSAMVVYLITYRTLLALNDDRASDLLRTAYTIVQDVAAKIEDDELRRSYLENVPAHRGIVAAYEKAHAVE